MSKKPDDAPPVRRIDRILTFMSLGILALAICCFIATIIAGAIGVEQYGGVWPIVFAVQMYGPIIAFAMLLTVIIMSFIRRGRANNR